MNVLPIQIIEKILENTFPDDRCLVDAFINLKYVCKTWNNIINQKSFWENICKKYNYEIICIINFFNIKYSKNIYKYSLNIDITIQQKILAYHLNAILYIHYDIYFEDENRYLIDYLNGSYNFSKIQYIDVSWRLLSMLYSVKYEYDFFEEFKNKMKSNIARGYDDKKRPFLAFKYINNYNKEIYTEIIYKNEFNEWTYMGDYNSYIGLLSHSNRELGHYSYDYIKKLILNKNCGYIFWKKIDDDYSLYESSDYLIIDDNHIPTVELFNHHNYDNRVETDLDYDDFDYDDLD